jgi:protein-S-isoprenylcysteine O-methyltransferase Ste14
MTFVALRSLVFAAGFLWLWAWVALSLRQYDNTIAGGRLPAWTGVLGIAVFGVGSTFAAWCIGAFVLRGRGTPAPFDAPRKLVIAGPYRYIRNPMYIGGGLALLGFGLIESSPAIVLFVPMWWVFFHFLVLVYEEPVLRAKFLHDYEEYCRRTPRWIPRLAPPRGQRPER